jgi:hypothetical protein
MNVSPAPTAAMSAPVASPAKAPAKAPAPGSATTPAPTAPGGPSKAGAVGTAVADILRSAGTGIVKATDLNGLSVDKAYIYPVEGAYATGKLLKNATAKVPLVSRILGTVGSGAGFVSAFHGMIMASMLRAPGTTVRELLNGVADAIDGRATSGGAGGVLLPVPPSSTSPAR